MDQIEIVDHIPKATKTQLLSYVDDKIQFFYEHSGYRDSYTTRFGKRKAGKEIKALIEKGHATTDLESEIKKLLESELKRKKRVKPHTDNGLENKGRIEFYKEFLDSMDNGSITRKRDTDFDLMPTDENVAKIGAKLQTKYKDQYIDTLRFKYKYSYSYNHACSW